MVIKIKSIKTIKKYIYVKKLRKFVCIKRIKKYKLVLNMTNQEINQNQQYVIPEKKERLDIYSIINYIKNSDLKTKIDKINYLKKYKHIHMDYSFLYNIIINNDLNDNTSKEVEILNNMLQNIKDINDQKISKFEGEKEIGELIADTYIKPMLEKNEEK